MPMVLCVSLLISRMSWAKAVASSKRCGQRVAPPRWIGGQNARARSPRMFVRGAGEFVRPSFSPCHPPLDQHAPAGVKDRDIRGHLCCRNKENTKRKLSLHMGISGAVSFRLPLKTSPRAPSKRDTPVLNRKAVRWLCCPALFHRAHASRSFSGSRRWQEDHGPSQRPT